jgi:cytoskeletal protein RodZ
MPLDTGRDIDLILNSGDKRKLNPVEPFTPSIEIGPDIGAALKAVREFRHLTLEQVAETTCIRRAYLAALEDRRLDALPSRPFTIGYIRAYANALGLDGEAAVRRFKADEPANDEPLRGPVGVEKGRDPRLVIVGVAGALVIAAIAVWNVAQRAMTEEAPPPAAVASAPKAAAKAGPLTLGAPLPAPVESTTPPLYETPGLEAAAANGGSADASIAASRAAAAENAGKAAEPAAPLAPSFTPVGAVYGAEASASIVTFQALKGGSLIVRGPDGSVYFARQLSVGEAYRAPTLAGLTADVSDPTAFQVFVGGQSKGLMATPTASIGKLAGAAPAH